MTFTDKLADDILNLFIEEIEKGKRKPSSSTQQVETQMEEDSIEKWLKKNTKQRDTT